jgi:hypothetical protein
MLQLQAVLNQVTNKLGEILGAAGQAVEKANSGLAAGKRFADEQLARARFAADTALGVYRKAEKTFNDTVALVRGDGDFLHNSVSRKMKERSYVKGG